MNLEEASLKAAGMGLLAEVDASGWCILRIRGCNIMARGGDWPQTFGRLAEVEAREGMGPPAPSSCEPFEVNLFNWQPQGVGG